MQVYRKRQLSAWVQLMIIVPMLFLSFFHVHGSVREAEGSCYQCVHHQPHNGHLTTAELPIHDCLLCQFVSTPYLAVATLVLIAPVVCKFSVAISGSSVLAGLAWDTISPRAPPFLW